MIRRSVGDDFLLIAQMDHAALAGELALHFGNAKFARAMPLQPVLTAVAMHDQGWPLHDDDPTLNPRGLPLDVFEVPRALALLVWEASAARAAVVDPYAGLLVSLHSLALSIHAASSPIHKDEKFDVRKMQDQFAVNKFQHREVERQEQLRRQLGLNTNLPLNHGLAEPHASAEDDRIRFDFRLLQAMDLISLCLCCTHPPQLESNEVLRSPAGETVTLRFRVNAQGALRVDPWPFDRDQIQLRVPCRRLPGRGYQSAEEFREVYRAAAVDSLQVVVVK